MKLVDAETNFYSHHPAWQIESGDVLSWAALNWMVAIGGLSKRFLEQCKEEDDV